MASIKSRELKTGSETGSTPLRDRKIEERKALFTEECCEHYFSFPDQCWTLSAGHWTLSRASSPNSRDRFRFGKNPRLRPGLPLAEDWEHILGNDRRSSAGLGTT